MCGESNKESCVKTAVSRELCRKGGDGRAPPSLASIRKTIQAPMVAAYSSLATAFWHRPLAPGLTGGSGGIPRVLVEYKKPVSTEAGNGARRLYLSLHSAQVINYASQIMFEYPEIGILPIIITDGCSFTAGYGKRDLLGSLVIVLCYTLFTLYAEGRMGPDFDLFWSMCNYTSPKCSLDMVVQDEPQVTVRVNKCIGHGAASFV